MSKPLIVEFPHDLGRDEARRRIEAATGKLRASAEKSGMRVDALAWSGDTLNIGLAALGQKVEGLVDIKADVVRIEVRLPLLLSIFTEKVRNLVTKQGSKLLTKA